VKAPIRPLWTQPPGVRTADGHQPSRETPRPHRSSAGTVRYARRIPEASERTPPSQLIICGAGQASVRRRCHARIRGRPCRASRPQVSGGDATHVLGCAGSFPGFAVPTGGSVKRARLRMQPRLSGIATRFGFSNAPVARVASNGRAARGSDTFVRNASFGNARSSFFFGAVLSAAAMRSGDAGRDLGTASSLPNASDRATRHATAGNVLSPDPIPERRTLVLTLFINV
jgi:hypothetical protein